VLFFVAGAIAQLGHSTVYVFGTRTFEQAGAPPEAIGWLWTTGVFAEIVLFLASRRVFARISPVALLALSAAGGVLRWSLLATATNLPALFVAQTLHGLTFGAQHLATIAFIEREVDEPGAAMGVAVALGSGVAFGVGMPLAGVLFEHFGRGAYHASTAFAAIATLVSLVAVRESRRAQNVGAGT
jgi:PPP family 3-phenylpropionic acid transporter